MSPLVLFRLLPGGFMTTPIYLTMLKIALRLAMSKPLISHTLYGNA